MLFLVVKSLRESVSTSDCTLFVCLCVCGGGACVLHCKSVASTEAQEPNERLQIDCLDGFSDQMKASEINVDVGFDNSLFSSPPSLSVSLSGPPFLMKPTSNAFASL